MTNREHVEVLLREAAADHERTIASLPASIADALPLDAQGLTRAIDHLAEAAGLSERDRRALVRPHATNPAVMHARVYGMSPLSADTVVGAYVEGSRVRANALTVVAEAAGVPGLLAEVRGVLVADPPPAGASESDVMVTLRATHAAQERAAMLIAAALDASA